MLISAFYPRFVVPSCDSPEVIAQVDDLIGLTIEESVDKKVAFKTSDHQVVDDQSSRTRSVCRLNLDIEGDVMTAYAMVKAEAGALGHTVRFALSLDGLEPNRP